MKVLVTVKEVATVDDQFTVEGDQIDERHLEYELNEWDEYAIETGVQLSEDDTADEVVSVTIGPERAEETIRMALAKGVDRAIRVWDDALDDDLLDIASKAAVLESIVAREKPDLVVTGVQASDDNFGATGVALADRIDYNHAAVVNSLAVEGDILDLRRELEGGVEELVEVDLPAVVTVQTGINEPRYASLRGIRQARNKEIDTMGLDELELSTEDVEGTLKLTSMYEPESESDVTLFEGDAEETAGELADTLRALEVGSE
jgi:electron transfer flavoprotein beta subunit